MRPLRIFCIFLVGLIASPGMAQPAASIADQLLHVDRAFSQAAQDADPVTALSSMMRPDIIMPAGPRGLMIGRDAVVEALRSHPALRGAAGVSWAPVRVGVSADGTHGFTYGYLTVQGVAPEAAGRKYLAYWVRGPEGWRVLAYKLVTREPGAVPTDLMPHSLPPAGSRRRAPEATSLRSLIAAEQAFSDEAQRVGLRLAFRRWGREDAMNIFGGAAFRVGLDAITSAFPESLTNSPIYWSAERGVVAPSGDFGITFGYIRQHQPEAGFPAQGAPFFTIWRRDGANSPWRYVAE